VIHLTAINHGHQPIVYDALRHAEAILTYTPQISTNKGGAGPSTDTRRALHLVREAILKLEREQVA
jgi:hypothetical protein